MKWRRIAVLASLQAQLPATDAASVLGLTDPRLCYVLDGLLFIYAVVMTALFVKAKLSQASEPQLRPGQDDVYNKLSRTHRDDYDVLGGRRGADPELGGRHQQRRKNPQDTVYTSLQKDKMGEAYSEIGMKGEQRRRGKGNEGLYQVGTTSHGCSLICPPSGWMCNGTVSEAQRSDRQLEDSRAGTRCLTNSSLLEAPTTPALGSTTLGSGHSCLTRAGWQGKDWASLEGLSGDDSRGSKPPEVPTANLLTQSCAQLPFQIKEKSREQSS
uniref:T-cell surface glycoprotein CD3 zeta chain n=1 Tax=Cyanoderma ruficeps TaxID=181631 RepID=A0A8C3R3F4_9PASS